MAGRAVTSVFVPHRRDFDDVVVAAGAREGNALPDRQNSWIIGTLTEGDVMVTDIFGKVEGGTVFGDNLGTAVASRTGAGAVIDGGVQDLNGLTQPPVNFFCRGTHPTAIRDVFLGGINHPVRIGTATVLRSDVVLGTPSGVIFLSPHLAAGAANVAEDVAVRDLFGKLRLSERVYGSADMLQILLKANTCNIDDTLRKMRPRTADLSHDRASTDADRRRVEARYGQ